MYMNRQELYTKKKLLKLLLQHKLRVQIIDLAYQAKVIIVEDNGQKYTIKHEHPDCVDHYLIPVYKRGNYYIRKWINESIIVKKRKNILGYNNLSTFVNLLWSMI
jgi:hypothetical protein